MEGNLQEIKLSIGKNRTAHNFFAGKIKEAEQEQENLNREIEESSFEDFFSEVSQDDLSSYTTTLTEKMNEKSQIAAELNKLSQRINELENNIQKFNQSKDNMEVIRSKEAEISKFTDIVQQKIDSGIPVDSDFVLEEKYLDEQYQIYGKKRVESIKKTSSITASINSLQTQLKNKEKALREDEAKVKSYIESGNDPSEIDNLRDEIFESRQNYYNIESLIRIYSKFISEIKDKNECPTCFRPFSSSSSSGSGHSCNDESKESALKCLSEMIDAFNDAKGRSERPEELEEKEERLWELKTKAEPARILRDESIPRLKREIEGLKEGINAGLKDLENAKGEEDMCKTMENFFVECRKYLGEITNRYNLINLLKEKIDMKIYGNGDETVLNEMQTELQRLKERERELKDKEGVVNSEIKEITNKIEDEQKEVEKRRASLSSLQTKKDRVVSLGNDIENCSKEIQKSDFEYAELKKKLEVQERRVNEERARVENGLKEINLSKERISTLKNQFTSASLEIEQLNQSYERELKSRNEKKAQMDRTEIVKIRKAILKLDAEGKTLSDTLSKRSQKDSELRSIKCAIEILRYERKCAEISQNFDVQEYEDTLKQRDELEKNKKYSEGFIDSSIRDLNSTKAALSQIRDYDTIDKKLRNIHIEIIARDKATTDLEMYKKGLEGAIMKYHETQMDQINSVIKELWQETYCYENWHNDIDFIKIVSNLELDESKKSYNYRVVMVKDGKEIDMRGRCSAGQKVLASLVIRMAIAEVFCVNCGVFAIDEPSTNLDEQNSIALAGALSNLIDRRKGIASFQLIVITHDPIFTDVLGRKYCGSFYYEVSKDSRTGKSTVKKKRIEEIAR